MNNMNIANYLKKLIDNIPNDWIELTTHRLDIYHEEKAKTEFLEAFETLYQNNQTDTNALKTLPTAYDYIRLGHPLSSILEWTIAKLNNQAADDIISFSSQTMPIMAILRKNLLEEKNTQINYIGKLPASFNSETVKRVYGHNFTINKIEESDQITSFDGSNVLITNESNFTKKVDNPALDFQVNIAGDLGSILIANSEQGKSYIADIQHVRRRESISMTPADSLQTLKQIVEKAEVRKVDQNYSENKKRTKNTIIDITRSTSQPLLGSSGLSIQYAIMMGLVDHAKTDYPNKPIIIIVPPNCYGGTNDQARRVAASDPQITILDLPVDGDNDMVQSTELVLNKCAKEDAVPLIIAEIPTNPRVEVPDLVALKRVLGQSRETPQGDSAVAPIFILDQTFCPNVQFLGDEGILSEVSTISYVSGSKFPSGGKCTAGYCVANKEAASLMSKVEEHLQLCNNEATALQVEILAEQLPSMNKRIHDAYLNTRSFVEHIQKKLPKAKINFVSKELADAGFTPSVFSLDLPTKGETKEEKETFKRTLNHRLINMMITEIPEESKYCVSYGQLKGCYWTIPATSTQGTTKEADKDYIARVSVSPNLDLAHHKKVFSDFVATL